MTQLRIFSTATNLSLGIFKLQACESYTMPRYVGRADGVNSHLLIDKKCPQLSKTDQTKHATAPAAAFCAAGGASLVVRVPMA